VSIAVVDIETASINPYIKFKVENDIICEIGIVELNLDSGKITELFDQRCQEDKCFSPKSWIFKHSNLKYSEVVNSNYLGDFKDEIQSIFNDYPVTAWNQSYDFRRLEHPSRGLKIENKFWDPMIMLTNLIKIPHPRRNGYKYPSVPEGWKYFNPDTKFVHKHRAIEDAKDEARILYQAITKWPELKDKI
jgi:hypothetical protein